MAYSIEYEINNINNICEETVEHIRFLESISKETEENCKNMIYYFNDLYGVLNEISVRLGNLEKKVQELSDKKESE